MSDNSSFLDNSTATQRLITATAGTQIFSNTQTDLSYSLDPSDTQDFFRLRLSQSSNIALTLNSQNNNADIQLIDAGGVLQSSQNGGTLTDAITTGTLQAGDYYVRVSLADNSTSTNYTLKVNTTYASRSDLLWRNISSGQNAVWQMNGSTIVSSFYTVAVGDPNWRIQATGDFNGDGSPDYVWRNYSTGQNAVWLMNADNTYRTGVYLTPVSDLNWQIAGTGDFNSDGQTDLIWRNYATGDNVYWLLNGTNITTSGYLLNVPDLNSRICGVGDFNGDNKPDLVWRNYTTGQNSIWLMNGLSLSSVASFLTLADPNWKIVGVGDFTGDSKQDILLRNYATGSNAFWAMNGTTYSTGVFLTPVADPNWLLSAVITKQPPSTLAGSSMGSAFNIGTLNNSGSYGDSIGGATIPNGYYKFNLTTASVLNLSLTGLTAGTNADLQVIQDTDGNGSISNQAEIIASSVNLDNADEQLSNLSLAAGSYFIRVLSSSTQSSTYSLGVSSAAAQQIDLLQTPSSTFTIKQTNGQALPATVSLKSGSSTYLSAVTVNYSVRNGSTANVTPSSFKVSFYLSRDNVITASDLLLGTIDPNTGNSNKDVFVPNLQPGTDWTKTQTLNLPTQTDSWWGGDQTYYIGMIIDSGNQVNESNENNNTANAAIVIRDTIQPDLVGNGLVIAQTSTTPGQAITFTGSIRNSGNKVAGSSPALVQFYFSNDDIFDGSDTPIASAFVKPIAALGSTPFDSQVGTTTAAAYFTKTTINLPDATWEGWRGNGRYYVVMRIDLFNFAQEGASRENNQNYGRLVGQYLDYDFIDITNAPNTTPV